MEPLAYTEADLMSIYEDVLAIPDTPTDQTTDGEELKRFLAEEDAAIIRATDHRFKESEEDLRPSETTGQKSDASSSHLEEILTVCRRILEQARAQVSRIESLRASVLKTQDVSSSSLPISVLSIRESEAFVRTCVSASMVLIYSYSRTLDSSRRCVICSNCTRHYEGLIHLTPNDQ